MGKTIYNPFQSGLADLGHPVALAYPLTLLDKDLGAVCVSGRIAASMADLYQVAVAPDPSGDAHHAVRGGLDRCPAAGGNIEPTVVNSPS